MITFNKTTVSRNEDKKICAGCSQCCKGMPGIVFPDQLKEITIDSVSELLNNGYCLDWWEGDPRLGATTERLGRALYIRPRIKGREDQVFHGAWGGECVFLTDTGCKHEFDDRPMECQTLVPNPKNPGSGCKQPHKLTGKYAASIAWLPYQSILEEAGNLVKKQQYESSITTTI